MKYRVVWAMDVTKNTPLEAALYAEGVQARQTKGNPTRIKGGVFQVTDEEGTETIIDLKNMRLELNKKEEQ